MVWPWIAAAAAYEGASSLFGGDDSERRKDMEGLARDTSVTGVRPEGVQRLHPSYAQGNAQQPPQPAAAPAASGVQGAGVAASLGEKAELRKKFDLTNPGTGEEEAAYLKDVFRTPGPAETHYEGMMGRMPSISSDPGYGKYFENERRKALENIDRMAAARGAYGSSAALGMGQEAITDLGAEQARAEADYNLRRLGEQRGWEQMAGGQAAGAQQGALSRNLAGYGTAAGAQGLREGRIGGMYTDQMQAFQQLWPMVMNTYKGMSEMDKELMDGHLAATLGATKEEVTANRIRQESQLATAGAGFDMYATATGGGKDTGGGKGA